MMHVGDAMRWWCRRSGWLLLLTACMAMSQCRAEETPVSLNFVIGPAASGNAKAPANKVADAANVVVWLTPTERSAAEAALPTELRKQPQIVQRHKTFEPHVLVVPVGTKVQFPNQDPFFHNIFSLYDGKRFDLGLYEAGSARSVLFDRRGVSFLFCNIHAEMSAVVVAVDTPYFGLSDHAGNVTIRNVPSGRYELNVWYERSFPEQLRELNRVVTILDASRNLGVIRIVENPDFTAAHKNKYGQDYVPPPKSDYDHR
jgi:plastocyanin